MLLAWFSLFVLFGVAYSLWLTLEAWQNLRTIITSGENGVYRHAAIGDLRTAIKDSLLAILLLGIFILGGLAANILSLMFIVIFIIALPFARLHMLHQPRRRK